MIVNLKISATIDGVNYPAGEHVLNKEVSEHWYMKALIGDGLAIVVKADAPKEEPKAEAPKAPAKKQSGK